MHLLPYLLLSLFGENSSKEIIVSQSKDSMDSSTCGNESYPCRTIDYALSRSVAGGVINIDGGANGEAPYIYKKSITINHCVTFQQWRHTDNKPSPKPILNPLNSIDCFCFGNFTVVCVDFKDARISIKHSHGRIQLVDCLFTYSFSDYVPHEFYVLSRNLPNIYVANGKHDDLYFQIKKSSVTLGIYESIFKIDLLSSINMRFYNDTISIDNSIIKGQLIKFYLDASLTNSGFVNSGLTWHWRQLFHIKITNCIFKNSPVYTWSSGIELNAYNTTFEENVISRLSQPALHVYATIIRVNLTKCLFRNNRASLIEPLDLPTLPTLSILSANTDVSQSWIRLQDTEFYASPQDGRFNIFDNPSLNVYKNTTVVCKNLSYANFFVRNPPRSSELEFDCSRCEKGTYNFNNRVTLNKNSWKKTSSCNPCPYNAICKDGKIRLTGGYWGYVDRQYKLLLISCPAYYCCLSKDECTSYNACSRLRTGRLCSECRQGFSSDISAAFRCIGNSRCKRGVVTFVMYTALALVITSVMLYLKEIILFIKTTFRCEDSEFSDRHENDDDDEEEDNQDEDEEGIFKLREKLLHESCVPGDSRSPISYQVLLSDDTTVMHSENYPQQPNLASGCVKIIFFYYQAAALIRIKSTDKIGIVIPKFFDVLSTVFNIRLDLSYSNITWCVFPDMNVIQSKMIKLGFVFIMLAVILTFWLSSYVLTVFKNKKGCQDFEEENPRPRHQQINNDVGWYSNPPFIVRVKCVYVQFLLFAFASIATFSFDVVHCVGINGKSYLYTQASIECYQPWQYVIIAFIGFWIVPFALSLYLAPKLLYQCYVSPNEFLLMLTFPPAVLGILVNRKFRYSKTPLTTEEAMLAKHLLSVLNQPFRESQDGGGKLCWESVLILRRMLLVITKTFIMSPITKLYPMVMLLLAFVSHHMKMKPFAGTILNDMEFFSILVLTSLVFVNMFWANTKEHGLMKSPEYKVLGKCLVFYEMVVLSLPFILFALYIVYCLLKLARSCFIRIKNMAIHKQD